MSYVEKRLKHIYSSERVVPPSMKWKTVTVEEYKRIYLNSVKDPFGFWAREAEYLYWVKPWSRVYEGKPPRMVWFTDGKLSAYYNIIGCHRSDNRTWSKPALIWEGEEGVSRVLTYADLDELVQRITSSLKALGVKPGDWVMLYAPPLPESIASMLAAVKLGSPFEPVFTGFGYYELAKRVASRRPKVLFVSDGFYRRGKQVDTLTTARRALELVKQSLILVVYERLGSPALRSNELSFADFLKSGGNSVEDYVAESGHPLFGLHSGYVEDHKPITHPVGGFLVQVFSTSRWIGLRPRDTYFCTVWPGWITGVSYVVFGPLMMGSTVVLYDGGPDYPSWDRWWTILEDYAVTLFLTTSSALRILSRMGDSYVLNHNFDTLKAILVTAEPLDVDTWWWTHRVVGTGKTPLLTSTPENLSGRIPVVNLYIQSEVGTFITGNLPNFVFPPIAPGSAGPPIPGFIVEVVNKEGKSVVNELGEIVIKNPWPSMPVEYPVEFEAKWSNGFYRTGDYGVVAEDGYVYPLGRLDGVLKVSGYRLSPGAIEKALENLLGVRAAVVKCIDEFRFEGIVVLYDGERNPEDVRKSVRTGVGPIAEPSVVLRAPRAIIYKYKESRSSLLEKCSDELVTLLFKTRST
ncbi:MAG: AMP-binding protein [Desulfurococcaceae archaeon]